MAVRREGLNRSEVRDILRSPNGPVARNMFRRGVRVQNQARRVVHVDTGRLRASITVQQYASARGPITQIGSNVEYAIYHEYDYPYLRPSLSAARTG